MSTRQIGPSAGPTHLAKSPSLGESIKPIVDSRAFRASVTVGASALSVALLAGVTSGALIKKQPEEFSPLNPNLSLSVPAKTIAFTQPDHGLLDRVGVLDHDTIVTGDSGEVKSAELDGATVYCMDAEAVQIKADLTKTYLGVVCFKGADTVLSFTGANR